ncbi:hypothetical protein LINPERHAP1_LOCUS30194 [Linum perenne]
MVDQAVANDLWWGWGEQLLLSTVVLIGDDGQLLPISIDAANGLVQDQAYGVVPMTLVLVGKLRWKFGVLRSEGNGVYVSCDVWVGLKRLLGVTGQVPLLASPHYTIDV